MSGVLPQKSSHDGAVSRGSQRLLIVLVLFCTASIRLAAESAPPPPVTVYQFSAGGKEQPLTGPTNSNSTHYSYAATELVPNRQPLEFIFGPTPGFAPESLRLQYRLEGWEDKWQDIGGRMDLIMRYLDEGTHIVGGQRFTRQGQSPGWRGEIATSAFSAAEAQSTAPSRARLLTIHLVSGTGWTTGIWVVRNLRVFLSTPKGTWEEVHYSAPEPGSDMDSPEGSPRFWERRGPNLNIEKVLTLDSAQKQYALGIIDNDPHGTGGWAMQSRAAIHVLPGQKVRVTWEEFYSFGQSRESRVSYKQLPPGQYTFSIRSVRETGQTILSEVSVPLRLVPPFYASRSFQMACGLVALFGVGASVRLLTQRRMRRLMDDARRQRMVAEERIRIAQDLHDEMGAGLTGIGLMAQMAIQNLADSKRAALHLEKVTRKTRELVVALDQIVWAVDPNHDTLEGLGGYLPRLGSELLSHSGIRFRPHVPALLPEAFIPSTVRYNILMIVKEALNNTVRHSNATEATLSLLYEVETDTLEIIISDNGRGLNPDAWTVGHGLENMKSRMEKLGGSVRIENQPGGGVSIKLCLKIPKNAPKPPAEKAV